MNKIVHRLRYNINISKAFYDALYINDSSFKGYNIATASMVSEVAKAQMTEGALPSYQATKLDSGLTVLSESVTVPSAVQLGIFLNVGSRDETPEQSGSMLSLKHTYLKTAINTNETVNYGIAQMSGGEFDMDYNRENTFYHAQCLSHDVVDVFGMMADCAFEPKNVVAASVGMSKLEEAHKLDAQLGGNQLFSDNIFTAAYGTEGLGNALVGSRNNVSNLTANVIQQFQLGNISADRVVISATGIENHNEFVDLVSEKMNLTQLGSGSQQRSPAQYFGGEIRNYQDSHNVHVAVAFEGANYADALPLFVAQEILGQGRKTGVLQRELLNKHVFINNVQAFSDSYSDSGLFGLKLAGSAAHVNEIVNAGAKVLSELRNASESDVAAAKAILKAKLGKVYTCDWRRLEDRTKSLFYNGKVNEDYIQQIDAITASDVQNAVAKALRSPLTFVAQGGQVNRIGSYDKITQLFQ